MEMNGEIPCRTSCAPFFTFNFNRSGSKEPFSFPGATWDRFRCRWSRSYSLSLFGPYNRDWLAQCSSQGSPTTPYATLMESLRALPFASPMSSSKTLSEISQNKRKLSR